MNYHVSKKGSDQNNGSKESPFLTINKAASVAVAGDNVIVHEGEYREWVNPVYAGLSDCRRITYQAVDNEKVIIKGSEIIKNWQSVEGTVWKVEIDNSYFGNFNPFNELIDGDWLISKRERATHRGDVYLNGQSLYEAVTLDQVYNPVERKTVNDYMTFSDVSEPFPEKTKFVWFAEVDVEKTTIYANFQGDDPNKELVEINVRPYCFYPERVGINYITVRGFEMAQAATPWTPPTADQPGLLGTHWSKGWIIEENIIHDAKTSAISLGKEYSTGDNYCTNRKDKPGFQYQLESVFSARKIGWSKEKIGSHIVRNNTIYDCGQNGVVGHLGCVFSEIYNNHIYNIALKREFYGWEIAGIKLHASIDVKIHHNRIHDCALGTWLDWQTQGTKIYKNIYYNNNRDFFVEVSHGPYLVAHNIFASDRSIDIFAQGGAYVNNLINGDIRLNKVLDRFTPYHAPHSTEVTGYACVYGGDDRYYNNLFIGNKNAENVGTAKYEENPTSMDEYIEKVQSNMPGDLEIFQKVEQPVYINKNAYLNGATAFKREDINLIDKFDPEFKIEDLGDEVYISINLPDAFEKMLGETQTTESLGNVRIVDAQFEDNDGTPLTLDTDLLNNKKPVDSVLGPICTLKAGSNRVKIWG